LIAGGAIFLEPERKEETDASCNEGEELEESIELMLAGYKKLEEPIHSNGMQTEGSIFKPMNNRNAREMVRNALKNATTLHPEKEKAIKIVKELGVDMNEDDCKRWRHAITRLYKEELDAYKNRVNSIKNNKIRIRMSLDAASIDARDRQDVDDAADGDAADCANAAANADNVGRLDAASIDARDRQDVDDAADGDAAANAVNVGRLDAASIDARDLQDVDDAADGDAAANAVNVGRLDAASIDARDLQDVDDAADGDAADCANVAANAAFYDVVDTLRQMPLARVFKPLQQDTAADDFDEIAKKCSYRRLKKRKFNEELLSPSQEAQV